MTTDFKHSLPDDWGKYLNEEFEKPYMKELLRFLDEEKKHGKEIYPADENIFAAFKATPFEKVKVIIIGQDPYHGEHQAHGLSFSVNQGVKTPPSLVNIFNELKSDVGIQPPTYGNLRKWAESGVLLLNNVLTVEKGLAGSHYKKGWEKFTDKVIQVLNVNKSQLVFILWGSPAQKKAAAVDENKHCLIKSVHPSPLSSYRGFFGSKPFSKTNDYLRRHGIAEIDWKI